MQTQIMPGEAPKLTIDTIEKEIVSEVYFTAADGVATAGGSIHPSHGLMTFCLLTLKNGWVSVGTSACASPENFDAAAGKKYARIEAIEPLWGLMGYELKSRLAQLPQGNLGEALTRLLAYRLGNPEVLRAEDCDTIIDHVSGDTNGTA